VHLTTWENLAKVKNFTVGGRDDCCGFVDCASTRLELTVEEFIEVPVFCKVVFGSYGDVGLVVLEDRDKSVRNGK
jgi:hypothetical protein